MIRKAQIDDFEAVKPLMIKAHAQSHFKETKMDVSHMKRVWAVLTVMPNMFCEIVEHNNKIVGVLGGGIDKNAWGVKIAMDIVFFAERGTPVLLRRFKAWSKKRGAEIVHITSLADNERYDRLLNRLDFKRAGQVFAMEV